MSDPDISVVISVYNAGDFLSETIDSLLGQRMVRFEIVAVDDGSTDDGGRLLDAYAQRDSRLRVIHQPNRGLTNALITGCQAASGNYIARHDAADLSKPHRLARQKEALDMHADLALVSCWTQFVGPRLEPLYVARGSGRARNPIDIRDLRMPYAVIDGPSHHGSVMFRRNVYERVGGYRPEFRFAQDWDLWYRLAEAGKFQMIEEVMYTARVSPDSISSRARNAQQKLAVLMTEMVRLRANGESDAILLESADAISRERSFALCSRARGLYFIGEALRRNNDPRCRSYLAQAAMRCPLLLKSWVRLAQSLGMKEADAHSPDL